MDFDKNTRRVVDQHLFCSLKNHRLRALYIDLYYIWFWNSPALDEVVKGFNSHPDDFFPCLAFLELAGRELAHTVFRHNAKVTDLPPFAGGYFMELQWKAGVRGDEPPNTADVCGQRLADVDFAGSRESTDARKEAAIAADI